MAPGPTIENYLYDADHPPLTGSAPPAFQPGIEVQTQWVNP